MSSFTDALDGAVPEGESKEEVVVAVAVDAPDETIKTFEGHKGGVNSVDYSSDGRFVVSGSSTVRIWDVDTGECVKTLEGHTNWVDGVSFSSNNQYVVSGSTDSTVRIWDVESGDCIKH